jgi:ABC-type glycerol-3-phosphate transport system substrate-binding protein
MFKRLTVVAMVLALGLLAAASAFASSEETGVLTVNGWYEGEEIYYIDQGLEEGVTARGENDIYVIGEAPRQHQAQVVEFIPGEAGYTPHWNVNFVRSNEGVTVRDIVNAGFASGLYASEGVLFDDVADILGARDAGLVSIETPGAVVLCPIISTQGAEAPGNHEAPEDFDLLGLGDSF